MKLLLSILLLAHVSFASAQKQYVEDSFGPVNPREVKLIISELETVYGEHGKAQRIAKRLETRLAQTTFTALEGLLKFTYMTLRANGHWSLAYALQREWHYDQRHRFERYLYAQGRVIGDYPPLSQWLADWYDKIEAALGKPMCDLLHISDIKSINHGIPVVFDPCFPQWTKQDFKEHFATDGIYHGLGSVVVYWVSYATCSFGSFGTGFFVFCAAFCNGVEYAFEYTIAGPLADKIYDLACGD